MMQLTTQTVSSIWPMMGELGLLLTPSQSKTFGVEFVTPERVTILTGKTRVMIPRNAFEAVLAYLHGHDHYAGNRCVIKSDNNYKKSGPLCKASRLLPTGAYGQRNITYVLPILQELGVVEINPKVPTSTWLVKHKVVAVVDRPLQSLIMGNTPPESLSPDQRAFAKHLAALWVGKPDSFVHRYQTSGHRAWGLGKHCKKVVTGGVRPWLRRLSIILGLKKAYLMTLPVLRPGFAWPLPSLVMLLRKKLVWKYLSGGGVARKVSDASRVWVMEQAAAKTLCSKILTAVELLQPGCSQSLAAFDGDKLLMNSAMTKVYAAASPNSIIIYDGRVGAALGLLVRHWLQGTGACVVPSDLAFRWGPNVKTRNNKIEKRDPTQGSFKFIQLYKVSAEAPNPTEVWAGLVRATNRILQSVIKTLAVQVPGVALLDLERALFMIGYDVRYSSLAVSK